MKARRAMNTPHEKKELDQDTLRERREAAKQQLRSLHSDKPKKKEASQGQHKELESREHKSAPTVMSTRRPVSRARTVVQPTQTSKHRDPRFDSLSAGPVNLDLLSKSYKFLPEMYENEIKSLKTTYDKLKRMEAHHAGPHAKSEQALRIREERKNVELALRRAESQRSERIRRESERSVKSQIKKENQRRVDAGLRPYFPKKGRCIFSNSAERTAQVLRHKYDQLSNQEGNKTSSGNALKKAMERKVRNDAQKDRKSLDAALGGGSRTDITPSSRGMRSTSQSGPPRKRGRRG